MSARREARVRDIARATRTVGGVPAALAIGRCIEVWADPSAETTWASAMRRFSAVRTWWFDAAGVGDGDGMDLIPHGSPWSIEFLTYRGQAERVGRRCEEIVGDRLAENLTEPLPCVTHEPRP